MIQDKADEYLNSEEAQEGIREMARRLVSIRRLRAGTERWESFAVDVKYCRSRCTS
ncbi:hypothetical protein F4810DRAFT_694169 [Camillea tinctor]|nr:hypothetical protein F4810DRAFT_694169 [Camillea tinctor]